MATLENFRPGPALDFSGITNALARGRNEEFAREKLAIDQAIADRRIRTDVATCGGPNPTDKTDSHGEELIINVI